MSSDEVQALIEAAVHRAVEKAAQDRGHAVDGAPLPPGEAMAIGKAAARSAVLEVATELRRRIDEAEAAVVAKRRRTAEERAELAKAISDMADRIDRVERQLAVRKAAGNGHRPGSWRELM